MIADLLNELRRLRNEIAHGRAPVDPTTLSERLASLGVSISPEQLPELIPILLQSFDGSRAGHLHIPAILSDVISRILGGRSAKTICDPWAGLGTVLAIAQNATSHTRLLAFNMNLSEAKLAKVLFPQAEWSIGAPLTLLKQLDVPVDVVVSCLPFGAKTKERVELADSDGGSVELRGELGHLILAEATAHLTEDGIGLFVVSPSLFFSSR